NQGHMVDLMRTKAPAEVALERTYNTLKGTVGSKGAEVVLKAHRDFFFATGAVVPLVNPEAIDDPSRGGPYENP
ncbi:SidE phosphodiesterase domain-containing protein, partial [Legionella pneumophila]